MIKLFVVAVVFFACGWLGRPKLDKNVVVVEGSSFASSTELDAVVYEGIDSKMHWGSGKVNMPAETPPDDPRMPKRHSSGDLGPLQASGDSIPSTIENQPKGKKTKKQSSGERY
jgi:hypothetical protein